MKYLYLSIFFLVCHACTLKDGQASQQPALAVTGNGCDTFLKPYARSAGSGALEENSIISFFSSGGITAENERLVFQKSSWQNDKNLQWNPEKADAVIYAYYPAMETDAQDLYGQDGRLEDVLLCHQTVPYAEPVVLRFGHLFSMLAFQASPELNSQLTSITFTPSLSISGIELHRADISLTAEERHPAKFARREDGCYTLIVPPAENLSVEIEIEKADGTSRAQLGPCTLAGNHRYKCRLLSAGERGGIYDADDFVAFSYLINGLEYAGRNLEEFGETTDGGTTYYLQNDIHFTPEDCQRLHEIGHYEDDGEKAGFKDCFDGQGHTLHDLELKPQADHYAYGLFTYVEATGIVRNLNLANATVWEENDTCDYTSTLIGYNAGTITNCHVKDSKVTTKKSLRLGGVVAQNQGNTLNCSIENSSFASPGAIAGGIACVNNGKLINCYMSGCDFTQVAKGSGLCFFLYDKGITENCYVYKSKHNKTKKSYAALAYDIYNEELSYCYYINGDAEPVHTIYAGGKIPSNVQSYDAETMVTTTSKAQLVIDRLNSWIPKIGARDYPGLLFHNWIAGDVPPVVLQSEGL